jgi:hypothetical protein
MIYNVLDYTLDSESALDNRDDRGHDVRVTTAEVAHLRRYHEFSRELDAEELREQYR